MSPYLVFKINKETKSYLMFVVILLMSFVISSTVDASNTEIHIRSANKSELDNVKNSDTGFTVKPVFGNQQTIGGTNYWSMLVRPKDKVKLIVDIINGEEDQTYHIAVNNAVTNNNLVVDYSKENNVENSMMAKKPSIDFYSNSVIGNSEKSRTDIFIKKNHVARIPITVDVPTKQFDGPAIGGVSVTQKLKDDSNVDAIKNIYNYTYAVVMKENSKKVKPVVEYNSIKTRSHSFDNTVQVGVKNKSNAFISGVSVSGKVTNNNGKELAALNISDGSIIPNGKFNVVFRAQTKKWSAGYYSVSMVLKDKEGNKWNLSQKIKVDSNGKITVNKVKPKQEHNHTLVVVILLVVSVLFIISVFFIIKLLSKRRNT